MGLPTLAIIGRPNVGKSTLFNRFAGKQLAIVDDVPGVTRDYRAAEAVIGGRRVQLYDTAGLEDDKKNSLFVRMREQTTRALELSDAAVFVLDGRTGLTQLDESLAAWLRKQNRKIIVVINKCEHECPPDVRAEVVRLGLGEPLAISASHGDGVLDLIQEVLKHLPQRDVDKEDEKPLRLAIVGRPNAGKSTLLNALLNEQRVMTGAEPGLTRDSIAVDWEYDGQLIRLVDTAGLRRRSRVDNKLEEMAVTDTQRIIRLAEIAIVVMDVQTLFDKQDLQITQQIIDEGRGLVLVINKWDLVSDKDRKAARKAIDKNLENLFHNAKAVPVITLSALQGGKELHALMHTIFKVYQVWNRRISTAKLNRWLGQMVEQNPPPMVGGRPLRLRYMTQVKARPPTFALWISRPDELPQSYEKFLLNHLRTDLDLPGVPLRLMRRKGENPYEGKKARSNDKQSRKNKRF